MENKTCFDLETALACWRAQLTAHDSVGAEDRRELEVHLREAVAAWIAKGLSTQEAFQIAAARLGPPQQIAAEFAKEDPLAAWRLRLSWMLIGILALRCLTDLAGAAGAVLSTIGLQLGLGAEMVRQELMADDPFEIFSSVQLAAMAVAPVLLYLLSRRFHTRKGQPWKRALAWLAASRTRLILTAASLVIAAALTSRLAAEWRTNVIRADILTLTDPQSVYELPPAKSLDVAASLSYSLLLILLLATVAPQASKRPTIQNE